MSVDICVASRDYGENVNTGSFQPTLWFSSVVEADSADESYSVG